MRTKHPQPLRSRRSFHQAAPGPPRPVSGAGDANSIPGEPEAMLDPRHDHLDVEHNAGELEEGFVPEADTWVQLGPLFRAFHPHLTGKYTHHDTICDYINIL